MADNSPSVELAPLKGSIILDLDQFDDAITQAEDKIVRLAELFQVALHPQIDIDFDNFDQSIDGAIEKTKQLQQDLSSLDKDIDININTNSNEKLSELHDLYNLHDEGSDSITDNELNSLFNREEIEDELNSLYSDIKIIANRTEETWVNAFEEGINKSESLLDKFDAAMLEKNKYLAAGIQATFRDNSIFREPGEVDESDDADLDPANNTGYGGGVPRSYYNNHNSREESEGLISKIGELGNGMMEKGSLLNWTITPTLARADESILKLGFTFETALQMANREFGANSSIITQWGANTVNTMGLSESAALSLADRFGMSAKSMGANKTQAADLGERMATLADQLTLATGGQIDLSTASQVLTGVMGGQMYGLQQLGITFSATQQNAESAALGFGKTYASLTPLQKAYVNTTLIQHSLNSSLGTLGDNLNTAYGQWSKTKAQLEENSEVMAEQLMPTILKVMHGITNLVVWFSHLGKGAHIAGAAILILATVVGPAMVTIGALLKTVEIGTKIFKIFAKGIGKVAPELKKVGGVAKDVAEDSKSLIDIFKGIAETAMRVGESIVSFGARAIEIIAEVIDAIDPITAIITVIVLAVIAAGVEIYEHWNTVKTFVISGFNDIKNSASSFAKYVSHLFTDLVASIGNGIKTGFDNTKNFLANIIKSVEHIGVQIGSSIAKTSEEVIKNVENTFKSIYELLYNNPIIHAIGYMCYEINNLFKVLDLSILHITESLFEFIWSWVSHYTEVIASAIGTFVSSIVNEIKHLFVDITGALTHFGEYIGAKLASITESIIHVVESIAISVGEKVESGLDFVMNKFDNFANWLGNEVMTPIHAIEIMATSIKNYMINGITESIDGFKSLWSGLTSWFTGAVTIPVHDIVSAMGRFAIEMGQGIAKGVQTFEIGWSSFINWFGGVVMEPIKAIENTASAWTQAGEHIIGALLQGIQSAFVHVADWIGNEISHLASDISHFAHDATSALSGASYHGSHATGLNNVPWDGYTAQLHKGEMVLTKDQADEYRHGGSAMGGVNVTINSPKPLDPFEVKRQMEQYSRNLANGIY